jgi:hypothetical protein
MSDASQTAARYWVLLGTPKGPWTQDELVRQLATGAIPPDTPVCREGSEEWLPCPQVLSTAPAMNPAGSPPVPTNVPVMPDTGAVQRSAAPSRRVVAAAVASGLLLLYGAYEWLRPSTALEVCRRFEKAETIADAKALVTSRMFRVLEQLYADKTPDDPNDRFELTRVTDGPDPTVRHVGLKGSWYIPEEGRRANVEGYLRVVRSEGWKIDDMIFTGIEGVSLPRPFSLVDEFQKTTPKTKSMPPPGTGAPMKPASRNRTIAWLEERSTMEILGLLGLAVMAWVANKRLKR